MWAITIEQQLRIELEKKFKNVKCYLGKTKSFILRKIRRNAIRGGRLFYRKVIKGTLFYRTIINIEAGGTENSTKNNHIRDELIICIISIQ